MKEVTARDCKEMLETKEMESKYEFDVIGNTWDIEDFSDRLGRMNVSFIRKHILLPNRQQIDVRNGGWCVFPPGQGGGKYKFKPSRAAEWIEEHWEKIMTGGWN